MNGSLMADDGGRVQSRLQAVERLRFSRSRDASRRLLPLDLLLPMRGDVSCASWRQSIVVKPIDEGRHPVRSELVFGENDLGPRAG